MKETKKSDSVCIHKDHRKRMRERYDATGFEGFSPHEILEFLLFYTMPRQDVNPLAHRLLDRFGSFSNVLDASPEELKTIDGVGDTTAKFLHMLPQMARYYLIDKQAKTTAFHSAQEIRRYLQPRFVGATNEKFVIMLFDNGMHLLYCEEAAEGSVLRVTASIRKMVELIIKYNATVVVLSHNHLNGSPHPSKEDLQLTTRIADMLNNIDVILLEHLIFTEDLCYPSLKDSHPYRQSINPDVFNQAFYNAFYMDFGTPIDTSSPMGEDCVRPVKNDIADCIFTEDK